MVSKSGWNRGEAAVSRMAASAEQRGTDVAKAAKADTTRESCKAGLSEVARELKPQNTQPLLQRARISILALFVLYGVAHFFCPGGFSALSTGNRTDTASRTSPSMAATSKDASFMVKEQHRKTPPAPALLHALAGAVRPRWTTHWNPRRQTRSALQRDLAKHIGPNGSLHPPQRRAAIDAQVEPGAVYWNEACSGPDAHCLLTQDELQASDLVDAHGSFVPGDLPDLTGEWQIAVPGTLITVKIMQKGVRLLASARFGDRHRTQAASAQHVAGRGEHHHHSEAHIFGGRGLLVLDEDPTWDPKFQAEMLKQAGSEEAATEPELTLLDFGSEGYWAFPAEGVAKDHRGTDSDGHETDGDADFFEQKRRLLQRGTRIVWSWPKDSPWGGQFLGVVTEAGVLVPPRSQWQGSHVQAGPPNQRGSHDDALRDMQVAHLNRDPSPAEAVQKALSIRWFGFPRSLDLDTGKSSAVVAHRWLHSEKIMRDKVWERECVLRRLESNIFAQHTSTASGSGAGGSATKSDSTSSSWWFGSTPHSALTGSSDSKTGEHTAPYLYDRSDAFEECEVEVEDGGCGCTATLSARPTVAWGEATEALELSTHINFGFLDLGGLTHGVDTLTAGHLQHGALTRTLTLHWGFFFAAVLGVSLSIGSLASSGILLAMLGPLLDLVQKVCRGDGGAWLRRSAGETSSSLQNSNQATEPRDEAAGASSTETSQGAQLRRRSHHEKGSARERRGLVSASSGSDDDFEEVDSDDSALVGEPQRRTTLRTFCLSVCPEAVVLERCATAISQLAERCPLLPAISLRSVQLLAVMHFVFGEYLTTQKSSVFNSQLTLGALGSNYPGLVYACQKVLLFGPSSLGLFFMSLGFEAVVASR